jgi:hypothetical protein
VLLLRLADELSGLCAAICPEVRPGQDERFRYVEAATQYVEFGKDAVGPFDSAVDNLRRTVQSEMVERLCAELDTDGRERVSASIRAHIAELCKQADDAVRSEQKHAAKGIEAANRVCFAWLGITSTQRHDRMISPNEWFEGHTYSGSIGGDNARRQDLATAINAAPRTLLVICLGSGNATTPRAASDVAQEYWTQLHTVDHVIHDVRDTLRQAVERLIVYLRTLVAGIDSERSRGEGDDASAGASLPNLRDLATAAGISDDTFRRVRKAADIHVKLKGAAARNRRYSRIEVDRLIQAALAGNFIERTAMASKWEKWSSKAASKPHGRR